MIEAACPTCGNIYRVQEGDIPVGARFVNCTSCKSRVPLPGTAVTQAMRPPPMPPKPPVAAPPKPGIKTEPIGLADLPMPKRASALGSDASKPVRSPLAATTETTGLPAPRGTARGPIAPESLELDLDDVLAPPAPASKPAPITDLPAPKAKTAKPDLSDLPAPKPTAAQTAAALPDLPAPKAPQRPPIDFEDPTTPRIKGIIDLPAPKAVRAQPVDLPAPKPQMGIVDLPAPRAKPDDLLAPKPAKPALPPRPVATTPKSSELPVPKLATPELPAPKGFFDDLPQPAATQPSAPPEPPAPKGFFDDLPQPAATQPSGVTELPAPKGFFDDLPQPARTPGASELPAPKGYFEDLPGRPNAARPEVPAPKGFFEDLPGRPNVSKPEAPAPKGFFDDLPGRVNTQQPLPPAPRTEPSAPPDAADALDLELDDQTTAAKESSSSSQFDDLDLSMPTPRPGDAAVRMRAPSGSGEPRPVAGRASLLPVGKGPELALELDPAHSPKLAPRRGEVQVSRREVVRAPRSRRSRVVVLAALLLGVLAGVGYVVYDKLQAKQAREQAIADGLQSARKAMTADDPTHWARAASAARKVLELDENQPQALGIGAEALLASALADGTIGAQNKAKKLLTQAKDNDIKSPEIDRARTLQQVAIEQGEQALPKLQALAQGTPSDLALQLYLGWAHAQTGNAAEAIKAFDRALPSPGLKVPALYGRARAKLAQVDLDGAKADFAAVLELAKDHIGAQVGLAAALPAAQTAQQEADVLAILQRKDLASSDPRAVTQAWVLAAEVAGRSNRLDVARERFKKALAVLANDVSALSGAAEVELRDGKLDAAAELLNRALIEAKDNMRAQLLQAELEIARKQLEGAGKRLDLLAARTPPPPPLERARLKHVTGRLLSAKGDDAGAVEAYVEASKLAGELDLAPLLAAVGTLTDMARRADEAKETAQAGELRARADGLLASVAAAAQKDSQLALTLGIAYLQVGAADKAEPWLRQAVEARAGNADAHYQLAKALAKLGRNDEAIASLRRASEIDAAREEIGIELARRYEAAGRDSDAAATYTRLLAAKDPSIELRARAGRFFARIGQIDKAAEQGEKILAVDRANAAGYYLKAEGLLSAKQPEEARKYFQLAADAEKDAQYLDGLGRAAQELAVKDVKYQDTALRAYMAAAELDEKMYNPRLGMGMLYVMRREFDKAVIPLLAAYKIKDTAMGAFLLGQSYKAISQAKVAIEWFEHSIKLEPFSASYFNLGVLYFDANQGARAAGAFANATRLGFEEEKKTGVTVPWLTEALYYQGRVNSDLHNDGAARDAWEKFVARKPPNDARLREATQKLNTELRQR